MYPPGAPNASPPTGARGPRPGGICYTATMNGSRVLKRVVIGLSLAALALWLVSQVMGPFSGRKRKIVRIDITGPILSSADVLDEIRRYRDDESVGAWLFRIDSPGGAVSPSQDIHAEILRLRKDGKGPVVVSIGSLGASGGYYIASAADRVWASPGSIVGSIGVILELTRFGELLRKIGVEGEVIKSGAYKDTGSPLRAMTPDERKYLQGIIDDTWGQFVTAVASGRGMDRERIVPLADGRVWTGSQALGLGLVDELGSVEDAVRDAARLAGIKGKPDLIKTGDRWRLRRWLSALAPDWLRGASGGGSPALLFLWRP
jgi:protease-4